MVGDGAPDPTDAHGAVEFAARLRQLKAWSGLTYRQLERRAADQGHLLPRSTTADLLRGRSTPRPDKLVAFVRACGDGDRVQVWLRTWEQIAVQGPATEDEVVEPPTPTSSERFGGRVLVASVAVAVLLLVALGGWVLVSADDPPAVREALEGVRPAPTAVVPASPSGWVRIRPATADYLCLTDGRVRDRRYLPLVAVQRPCADVAPQNTMLESMGGDLYRIQWHHPDYGRGCLKVLPDGLGVGLLEPMDDCRQGSQFHLEPAEPHGSNRYVLRVDGRGCVGIRGSAVSEGVEAVMDRCVGKGGQIFIIEAA